MAVSSETSTWCTCSCRYGAQPDRGPAHVDVFRDFAPESAAAAGASSSAQTGPSSAAAAAAAGAAGNAPKLSDLFKPPVGLVFQGDWQTAGAEASKQGRWLLANIQSADEFATHRLNRDTWSDALVQDMLKGSFIFWQVSIMNRQHLQMAISFVGPALQCPQGLAAFCKCCNYRVT